LRKSRKPQKLGAPGPTYLKPHLAARARIERARNTNRMVTAPKSSAAVAIAVSHLSRITAAILIHLRRHV